MRVYPPVCPPVAVLVWRIAGRGQETAIEGNKAEHLNCNLHTPHLQAWILTAGQISSEISLYKLPFNSRARSCCPPVGQQSSQAAGSYENLEIHKTLSYPVTGTGRDSAGRGCGCLPALALTRLISVSPDLYSGANVIMDRVCSFTASPALMQSILDTGQPTTLLNLGLPLHSESGGRHGRQSGDTHSYSWPWMFKLDRTRGECRLKALQNSMFIQIQFQITCQSTYLLLMMTPHSKSAAAVQFGKRKLLRLSWLTGLQAGGGQATGNIHNFSMVVNTWQSPCWQEDVLCRDMMKECQAEAISKFLKIST